MWTQKQIKKGVCFVYKYDGVQFSKSDHEGGVESKIWPRCLWLTHKWSSLFPPLTFKNIICSDLLKSVFKLDDDVALFHMYVCRWWPLASLSNPCSKLILQMLIYIIVCINYNTTNSERPNRHVLWQVHCNLEIYQTSFI